MREQTVCSVVDQGFGAAAGNVSDAVSIRTISAGKGPEELKCISWNCGHCICQTPVPDQAGAARLWLGLAQTHGAHAACTACGKCGEFSLSVLGPQGVQGAVSVSPLLVEIKQAATNPAVPLHWVHRVFPRSCFKTLPVLQTQALGFCLGLLQVVFSASPLVLTFSFHIL